MMNIRQEDGTLDFTLREHIHDSIEKNVKNWIIKGASALVFVVLGYIIATVWDLNGKIYEVAGKQTIQYDFIEDLKRTIYRLEVKNASLSKEKDVKLKELFNLRQEIEKLTTENNKLRLHIQQTEGADQ